MDEVITPVVFELEELRALNLDDEIREGELYRPRSTFGRHAEVYQQANNPKLTHLYSLLNAVSWPPHLDPASSQPFPDMERLFPLFFTQGQLRPEEAETLERVLSVVENPWFKARLGDVLWVFAHNYRAARQAVQHYLEYSRQVDDPEEWIEPVSSLNHALYLARSLGKKEPLIQTVLQEIEARVTRADGNDPLFYSHQLIELLLQHSHGDPDKWAALLKKLAEAKEAIGNPHAAHQHWQLAVAAYRAVGDDKAITHTIEAWAEFWIRMAENGLKQPSLARFIVADYYQRAIDLLRGLGTRRERVKSLKKALIDVQDEALDQLVRFEQTLSSNDPKVQAWFELYVQYVQRPDLLSSVLALGELAEPPPFEKTKANVEEHQKTFLLHRLMPTMPIGMKGQNVAKRPDTPEADSPKGVMIDCNGE